MDISAINLDDINVRITVSQAQQEKILEVITEMKKQIEELGKTKPAEAPAPANAAAATTVKSPEPPIPQTYARILKDSLNDTKKIRHIDGKGDDIRSRAENLAKFRDTDDMKNMKTVVIRAKGTSSYTVTFETEEDAIKLDELIATKFTEMVESKQVTSRKPMVKVIRIPAENTDKAAVLNEIKRNNEWLAQVEFEISQVFTIATTNGNYTNCTIQCEVETQEDTEGFHTI